VDKYTKDMMTQLVTNENRSTYLFCGISATRHTDSLPRPRLHKAKNLHGREDAVPEPCHSSVVIPATDILLTISLFRSKVRVQRILTFLGKHKDITSEKGFPWEEMIREKPKF
jgi:hypothetical protein